MVQFNLGCATKLQNQKILPCTFYWLKITGVWITLNPFLFFLQQISTLIFLKYITPRIEKSITNIILCVWTVPVLTHIGSCAYICATKSWKFLVPRINPQLSMQSDGQYCCKRTLTQSWLPKTVEQLLDVDKYPHGCELCFSVSVRAITGFFCLLL